MIKHRFRNCQDKSEVFHSLSTTSTCGVIVRDPSLMISIDSLSPSLDWLRVPLLSFLFTIFFGTPCDDISCHGNFWPGGRYGFTSFSHCCRSWSLDFWGLKPFSLRISSWGNLPKKSVFLLFTGIVLLKAGEWNAWWLGFFPLVRDRAFRRSTLWLMGGKAARGSQLPILSEFRLSEKQSEILKITNEKQYSKIFNNHAYFCYNKNQNDFLKG